MQLFAFTYGRMHARKPPKVLALTNFSNFFPTVLEKKPKKCQKKEAENFWLLSSLFQLLKVMVLKTGRMAFTDSF